MSIDLAEAITRVRAVDWTGQKSLTLNGNLITGEISVGELAEAIRERMQLPRGSYAVYLGDRKLSRSSTLAEAGVTQDAELELSPEVKAARASTSRRGPN
jgi:hypothetical protein